METGWAEANFWFGFLNAILPEKRQAEVGGSADGFGRLAFADGLQGDRFRRAANAAAGGINTLLNTIQVRSQVHIL